MGGKSFLSYYLIDQNQVTWPCLAAKESGKISNWIFCLYHDKWGLLVGKEGAGEGHG